MLDCMATKKSTIQIPVTKDGHVPHWTEKRAWCEHKIAETTNELQAGFKPVPSNQWKPFYMENETTWRTYLEGVIDRYQYDWRDPWEFVDTFQIEGYGRGRSSAVLNLKSTTTGME